VLWCTGLGVLAMALLSPLAEAAHHDFTAHMAQHLLLGMLTPLLLVLAAPATLALRALPVPPARRLARLLRSRPVRYLTDPIVAATLDAGGLWLLYTTSLYRMMVNHPAVHLAVHVHVLAAGCLFTFAIVGVDPAPHRPDAQTWEGGHGRRCARTVRVWRAGVKAPPWTLVPAAGRSGTRRFRSAPPR
jgi:putative membrane protein